LNALPQSGDADLVTRASGGDREAFREIVQRYQWLVFQWALRATGQPAAAEDLVQMVTIQLWRTLGSFRGADLRPWLRGIFRNVLRDARKTSPWAKAHRATNRTLGARGDVEEFEREVLRGWTETDTAARDSVREAIADLPDEERSLIVAHHLEGEAIQGLAEAHGLTEDQVKKRLVLGRERLRELLEAKGGGT